MKIKKVFKVFIIMFILSVSLVGCTTKPEGNTTSNTDSNNTNTSGNLNNSPTEKGVNDKNPVATIKMEDGKVITIELYPEVAPNTVRNFISLANSKFYDGLIFHRVIPGFMIQGGDPKGNGTGGPDYSIFGEFSSNGFNNPTKHTRGVISMARSKDKNSAGAQFFIMHEDYPSLDGEYAAFGNVIEGMEVVDEIAQAETASNDKPVKDIKIKSITVETFGVKYKEVEKYTK
ncbi:peptidylprolyl isomerase [Clostridium sp.]|uniref:peptidylprolyl isomerase n=1 Tax=Clostridium sp. TaxID=1506 RepID=UPI002FC8BB53